MEADSLRQGGPAIRSVIRFFSSFLVFYISTPATAQDFELGDYLQLTPGSSWTFQKNGTESSVERVLAETEMIGQALTNKLEKIDSDDECPNGEVSNLTISPAGLLRYRTNNLCSNDVFEFIEAFTELPASADYDIPEIYDGTGTFSFIDESAGPMTIDIDWDHTVTIREPEDVTVPLGSFSAVRIESSRSSNGEMEAGLVVISEVATDWLAIGVGPVKRVATRTVTAVGIEVSRESETKLLVSVPEPRLTPLRCSALLSVSFVAAIRRRRQHAR